MVGKNDELGLHKKKSPGPLDCASLLEDSEQSDDLEGE